MRTIFEFFYANQIIVILLVILLSIYIKSTVKHDYKKYDNDKNSRNLTGAEIARSILHSNKMYNTKVITKETFSKNDSNEVEEIIVLPQKIYDSTSLTSVALSAYEIGHLINLNSSNSTFLKLRNKIMNFAFTISNISGIVIIIGYIVSIKVIFIIGIILLCIGLILQILLLPVEIKASNTALVQLTNRGLIVPNEYKAIRNILKAATLVNVVDAAGAITNISKLFKRR